MKVLLQIVANPEGLDLRIDNETDPIYLLGAVELAKSMLLKSMEKLQQEASEQKKTPAESEEEVPMFMVIPKEETKA